jgi:hypothetical protein
MSNGSVQRIISEGNVTTCISLSAHHQPSFLSVTLVFRKAVVLPTAMLFRNGTSAVGEGFAELAAEDIRAFTVLGAR